MVLVVLAVLAELLELVVEGTGLLALAALIGRVGLLWAKHKPVALRRTAATATNLRVIFMGSFVLGLLRAMS